MYEGVESWKLAEFLKKHGKQLFPTCANIIRVFATSSGVVVAAAMAP